MDEIDYKILQILRQDARCTNSEIGAAVKLTEGAVRNRIKRLKEASVIKRFTIETQPDEAEAIVLIRTQTKTSKEILKRIRKYSTRLFETAGEYDVAAYLAAQNVREINENVDRLRGIDGVISTMTLLKIAEDQLS